LEKQQPMVLGNQQPMGGADIPVCRISN